MNIKILTDGKYGENSYIIYDEKGVCALIDPVSSEVFDFIKENSLVPGAVLLTHGHFDHISGLESVLASYSVPLYIHANDAEMLSDPEKNASMLFEMRPTVCTAKPETVTDGEKINIGNMEFKTVHTPGHTSGSVCYFCEDAVFSGDTIFADGYGRTDLYGASEEELRDSVVKLSGMLVGKTIYPGHGKTRKF